ncbi:unnamed protein product [Ceratitis capitata]|uniref:(Mediterranean fruit fly) hypothetical protein n=1 Tax=Ceratitis capitata TaxID=7213 RepID=A0A811V7I8_CERCA|nr:unnamed protein product [Ceratitis capitata]
MQEISSPYVGRPNIKIMLVEFQESKTVPYPAVMNFRNTLKGNTPSAAELLMSRKLKTEMPTIIKILKPEVVNECDYREKSEAQNIKKENIIFKINPSSVWFPGVILNKYGEPWSCIVRDS